MLRPTRKGLWNGRWMVVNPPVFRATPSDRGLESAGPLRGPLLSDYHYILSMTEPRAPFPWYFCFVALKR